MRTLKDLESDKFHSGYAYASDLRDVAREWIKAYDNNGYLEVNGDFLSDGCDEYSCDNVRNWIRMFFNLDEGV